MKVIWSPEAIHDRHTIFDYIATHNPGAAVRLDIRIEKMADDLADFPHMGHHGDIAGTLELFPHENYRMIYEVDNDRVLILMLVHTSRQWPPSHQDI